MKVNSKKLATTVLQSTPRNVSQLYPANFRDVLSTFMTIIVINVYFQKVKVKQMHYKWERD